MNVMNKNNEPYDIMIFIIFVMFYN